MMKRVSGPGLVLIVVAIAGCGGTRTIGEVLADPSRYSDRDVRVEGQVVQSYSILGQGAYRVEDSTGRLWIVSQTGVPNPGARVSVSGRVQQGFNLGGIIDFPGPIDSAVVMLESSHDTR
jgi:hypothetical protein